MAMERASSISSRGQERSGAASLSKDRKRPRRTLAAGRARRNAPFAGGLKRLVERRYLDPRANRTNPKKTVGKNYRKFQAVLSTAQKPRNRLAEAQKAWINI